MSIYGTPPDRLFEGMAESLLDDVLPHTEGEYARAQVRGVAELLRNLRGRMTWDPAPIEPKRVDAERALGRLGVMPAAPAPGTALESLIAVRDQLGEQIDGIYADGEPDPERLAAVWDAVRADFDQEAAAIKTGGLGG